mgnify:FL=1
MKNRKLWLAVCIAIPLLVGVIASVLTRQSMQNFAMLKKPPFAPPAWVFPVVWTILYVLMGISSYLILTATAEKEKKENALLLYWYQLAVNFLWPTFFFNFEWYLFSFFWIILLWVLVFLMILRFYKIDKRAAYLNIPYLIWLVLAAYLNLGIWWLN